MHLIGTLKFRFATQRIILARLSSFFLQSLFLSRIILGEMQRFLLAGKHLKRANHGRFEKKSFVSSNMDLMMIVIVIPNQSFLHEKEFFYCFGS